MERLNKATIKMQAADQAFQYSQLPDSPIGLFYPGPPPGPVPPNNLINPNLPADGMGSQMPRNFQNQQRKQPPRPISRPIVQPNFAMGRTSPDLPPPLTNTDLSKLEALDEPKWFSQIKEQNLSELKARSLQIKCASDNSSRKLLQALIIVFTLFAFGLLILYFVFGTKPTANKASKYAYVAVSATFILATIISSIALTFYAKKTCRSCTAT